jgi:uncharacterized protein YjbI with pentapeptide repeats
MLAGANLSHVNLTGATIELATCNFTSFVGANLAESRLSGSQFRVADLSGADFSRATFHPFPIGPDPYFAFKDTSFVGCRFAAAEMSGCDFSTAYFEGVDFSSAKLSGADFSLATIDDGEFSDATAGEAIFSRATLRSFRRGHGLETNVVEMSDYEVKMKRSTKFSQLREHRTKL